VPYTVDQPIDLRTARHVAGVKEAVETFSEIVLPEETVIFENIPSYADIKEGGIGKWLKRAN
jgi:hypothetical protein